MVVGSLGSSSIHHGIILPEAWQHVFETTRHRTRQTIATSGSLRSRSGSDTSKAKVLQRLDPTYFTPGSIFSPPSLTVSLRCLSCQARPATPNLLELFGTHSTSQLIFVPHCRRVREKTRGFVKWCGHAECAGIILRKTHIVVTEVCGSNGRMEQRRRMEHRLYLTKVGKGI